MSVRDDLVSELRTAAGPGVHVIPWQDSADELDRITIMVKQVSLEPLPAAPAGALQVNYVVTIASASIDAQTAETELDEFVPALLADLAPLSWFAWTTATKVLFQSTHLAYDVDAFVIATPKGD